MKSIEILKEEQKLNDLQEELNKLEDLVKNQRKKVLLMKLLQRLGAENDLSL